jgi:hypothetical protein
MVSVKVDQPLLRGVWLKEDDNADGADQSTDKEQTWFDLKYEKVPHFCFDYGCLVHGAEGYRAEKEDIPQWGEWLRASPRRNNSTLFSSRPTWSSASRGSRSEGSEQRFGTGGSGFVRYLPPKRHLYFSQSESISSRTGGYDAKRDSREVTSPEKNKEKVVEEDRNQGLGPQKKKGIKGTYTRRPRAQKEHQGSSMPQQQEGNKNRKRSTKQVWVQVPVQVIGEGSNESAGKRQRTASVFDRIEEPSVGQGERRAGSVFERIEEPAADPAMQGRRDQWIV